MSESVKVVVRCRPFSQKEKNDGHTCIVQVNNDAACISIKDPNMTDSVKKFTFDSVFDSDAEQSNLYNLTARPIVDSVLNGYNGTIFAYGQTGTGKTFTMSGLNEPPELRGIIPNAIEHVFQHIKGTSGINFLVRASYLEIYNEEIRDLLNPKNTRLEIKERPDIGVYVKDLQSFVIKDANEMDRLMTFGNKNRSVGATLMNERSSRSHSIFSITVEASETDNRGTQHIRAGKLHLVDLAGSERQSKTGATGDRLKEATKINLSLSALGNVISSLVDGKSTHIPYRDSKLTRLLQDSLGGNAKTLMIATLSPASYNHDESISTLRYANRAKNIKNKPTINEDPKDALLRQFQEEIERLRAQLKELETPTTATLNKDRQNGENKFDLGELDNQIDQDVYTVNEANDLNGAQVGKKNSKFDLLAKNNESNATATSKYTEKELSEMQKKLEKEKLEILASKTMEESEKQEILKLIELRSSEIYQERLIRQQLAEKLSRLEKQLLVGNENLLDKEAQQRELLAKQAMDLEERKRKERQLQRQLEESENTKIQIAENYSNLQEEALLKTKKLKKLWTLLTNARGEIKDLREEHQREREDLLQTVRAIYREIKLCSLVINQVIPQEYQEMIEKVSKFDENSETWHITHVAHAGNNVRGKNSIISGKIEALRESAKLSRLPKGDGDQDHVFLEDELWTTVFPNVYLSYEDAKLSKRVSQNSTTGNRIRKSSAALAQSNNVLNAGYNATVHRNSAHSSLSSPKRSSRPASASSSPHRLSSIPNVTLSESPSSASRKVPKSEISVVRGLVSKPVRYA